MSYFFLLSYLFLFDFYMKCPLGIVNDEHITFIKEKATTIWVPVQREQDIDFFKNLCHFWKRSRYCKRRAYLSLISKKKPLQSILSTCPKRRTLSTYHITLYASGKNQKILFENLRLFFCTQIPYLGSPYFNANKAKKEHTELVVLGRIMQNQILIYIEMTEKREFQSTFSHSIPYHIWPW